MRAVPHALTVRALDGPLATQIAQAGLIPLAARGHVEVPARGDSPARKGQAVVCRLLPVGQATKIAFLHEGQKAAEAVVFEDPDDVFEWNLRAGFENALHAARHVIEAQQGGARVR